MHKEYADAFGAVPGCKVIWCKSYDEWSGKLLAKIDYKGEILFIYDWFGSCAGCDPYWSYFEDKDCRDKEALCAFGKPYVESAYPLANIIELIEKEYDQSGEILDDDAIAMLADLAKE